MKFRGNIIVSYEILKEALKLPKDVDIINVYITDKDRERETITLTLRGDATTEFTTELYEADRIPTELFDNYIINK